MPEDWVFEVVEAFSLEEKSSSTPDGGKGFWVWRPILSIPHLRAIVSNHKKTL